jgi:hypothetical protein
MLSQGLRRFTLAISTVFVTSCGSNNAPSSLQSTSGLQETITIEESVIRIPDPIAEQTNKIIAVWSEGNYGEKIYLEGGEEWFYIHLANSQLPKPPLELHEFKGFFHNWEWNGVLLRDMEFRLLSGIDGIAQLATFKAAGTSGSTQNCLVTYKLMIRWSDGIFGYDCRKEYLLTGPFMYDFLETAAEFTVDPGNPRRQPGPGAQRVTSTTSLPQ